MIGSLSGKWVLVLLGTGLVFTIGGWKIWSLSSEPITVPEPKVEALIVAVDPPVPPPVESSKPAIAPVVVSVDAPQPKDPPAKKKLEGDIHEKPNVLLTTMMSQLHMEAYRKFISQPGMGYSRMMPTITVVKRDWKMPEWTSEELAKEPPPEKGVKDLTLIHRFSLDRFAEAKAKSPMKAPPQKEQLWEIKSLDLVGLVVHETPKVYVSEKLPDMKDLKKTPTRELDLFESEGLEQLVDGKELYVRAKAGTIRVLGPIHAEKACLKCHDDAKEGTMLGAFSYTLRPGQYQSSLGGMPFNPRGGIGNFGGLDQPTNSLPKK